jgi:hypothetical protein
MVQFARWLGDVIGERRAATGPAVKALAALATVNGQRVEVEAPGKAEPAASVRTAIRAHCGLDGRPGRQRCAV